MFILRITNPDAKPLHGEIKHYYNIRNEIQVNDNLL